MGLLSTKATSDLDPISRDKNLKYFRSNPIASKKEQ